MCLKRSLHQGEDLVEAFAKGGDIRSNSLYLLALMLLVGVPPVHLYMSHLDSDIFHKNPCQA